MAISMLKIRRPLGRPIFNMGIAIPGKTVFLIETAPRVAIISTSFTPKYPRYMNILLMQLSACPALCHHEAPFNINARKIVY